MGRKLSKGTARKQEIFGLYGFPGMIIKQQNFWSLTIEEKN
jgi:hypothetical protein